jgi:uncharacterized membrane protein YoaT (DUF817 family)
MQGFDGRRPAACLAALRQRTFLSPHAFGFTMAQVSTLDAAALLWPARLWSFFKTSLISSAFALSLFAMLALTKLFHLEGIPRYDLVLLMCLACQWVLVASRWETLDELKVICVFHLLGLGLECFKVSHGAWDYPDRGYLKMFGVPLYSGFMYASIGSYICQAWRRFELRFLRMPPLWISFSLALLIYINFFSELVWFDARWILASAVILSFWKSKVSFKVFDRRFRMPVTQAFLLIGLFIWVAENICTRLGAWRYPYQRESWTLVHGSKIGSWCLLVILSFVLVAGLKQVKGRRTNKELYRQT